MGFKTTKSAPLTDSIANSIRIASIPSATQNATTTSLSTTSSNSPLRISYNKLLSSSHFHHLENNILRSRSIIEFTLPRPPKKSITHPYPNPNSIPQRSKHSKSHRIVRWTETSSRVSKPPAPRTFGGDERTNISLSPIRKRGRRVKPSHFATIFAAGVVVVGAYVLYSTTRINSLETELRRLRD
jgi:hypothetical protein